MSRQNFWERLKMKISNDFFTCANCGVKTKNAQDTTAGFLCRRCYRKTRPTIYTMPKEPKISMEKALKKIYEIKGYVTKKGSIVTDLSPPHILIGHKIKFVLADEEDET